MSVRNEPETCVPAPTAHLAVLRALADLLDRLFGPPRVQELPDGTVAVRLLGRRFEAATRAGLFDAVVRKGERLLISVAKMHEGAAARPLLAGGRFGDSYHQMTRRLEDRVALYSAFIGRLAKELD